MATGELKKAIDWLHTYTWLNESQKIGMVAQWLHESARGTSKLAKEHNNFAGLKWRKELAQIGASPRSIQVPSEPNPVEFAYFESPEMFVNGYIRFLDRSPYVGWREISTGHSLIAFLHSKGFAVDDGYMNKVPKFYEEAKALLYDQEPSQPSGKPSWWELYRTNGDPLLIGWAGGTAVGKIQTKLVDDLIAVLEDYKDSAKTFAIAPSDKRPPDVSRLQAPVDKPDEQRPVKPSGLKVFLEAGHGWSGGSFDPGAVGHVQEWAQNKEQAEACANYLRARGAEVKLELYNRGTPARSLRQRGKASGSNHIFVSFHNNASGAGAQGTETFADRPGMADKDDIKLARTVQKYLAEASPFRDRGMKQQGLGVLRGAKPQNFAACLTEGYFVDGPGLTDVPALNKTLGEAIAKGILAFADEMNLPSV